MVPGGKGGGDPFAVTFNDLFEQRSFVREVVVNQWTKIHLFMAVVGVTAA